VTFYKYFNAVEDYHARTHARTHAHTHTHTIVLRLFWILSGTTQESQYKKGKTRKVKPIWIYWSKRKWVAVASAGQYANLHLTPDRLPAQHPTTVFTGRMPFLPPN